MDLALDLIRTLSRLCGILPGYSDIFGCWHETPVETQKRILRAMGLSVDTAEALAREIRKREDRAWTRFIDPVQVLSVNEQPFSVPVSVAVAEADEGSLRFSWELTDENGGICFASAPTISLPVLATTSIEGRRYARFVIPCRSEEDRPYPMGYYTLHVSCSGMELELSGSSRIILAPEACYIPPSLKERKLWGLSLNLYSLRSERNWGVGDLADLAAAVKGTAEAGGGFVGINPLHSIANSSFESISPYSPISRIYRNCLYLDLEQVPDVRESSEAQELMASASFKRRLEGLREKSLIDYAGAAAMKEEVLRKAFAHFHREHLLHRSTRGRAFETYAQNEGSFLETHATYMAISRRIGGDWRRWPKEFHDPSGQGVLAFRDENRQDVFFFMYTQWLMDSRLREVAAETQELGMPVGIYNDLAIGSVPGGSDAWRLQEILAGEVDVGAPPDDFSREGQNWGFPPPIPESLRYSGYDYLIRTLRANMRHGGALRIDHALGIFRLFWIPQGIPSSEGAYVEYPSEEILRIIALESVRNRTVIIGEDLGTIGENVRESLSRFSMLSYRLLYFERDYPEPVFTVPHRYPEMALCSITTHDLPTLYGYWKGRDLEIRAQIGLYPDEEARLRDETVRERDKRLLIEALRAEDLFNSDASFPEEMSLELFIALYVYLSRSACKLLSVNLDDAIGTVDQQNLPGQGENYPCWAQKTPISLEEILTGAWLPALSVAMEETGRSSRLQQPLEK